MRVMVVESMGTEVVERMEGVPDQSVEVVLDEAMEVRLMGLVGLELGKGGGGGRWEPWGGCDGSHEEGSMGAMKVDQWGGVIDESEGDVIA